MDSARWDDEELIDEGHLHEPRPVLHDEPYDDFRYLDDRWATGLHASRRERTVSYVVLVDGRVVDSWHEPLVESPWLDDPRTEKVQRLWRERPRPRPEPAPWLDTVRWLEHLAGGPEALAGVTTDLLPDEPFHLPEQAIGDGDLSARFRKATSLLDDVAARLFDLEMRTAFRRALAVVGLELLTGAQTRDPAQVAAAVCWMVAKANGAMTPMGQVTQKAITTHLGLPLFPRTTAQVVSRLLGSPRPPWVSRPRGLPELEPLTRTDVLTSRTRREIVSLRDAALAAEAGAAARERTRLASVQLDLPDAS